MKNIAVGISAMLIVFASLTACQQAKDKADDKDGSTTTDSTSTGDTDMAKLKYTCSMHPEVISDKPGKCPKCGMELIKKEEANEHIMMSGDSSKHDH